MEAEYFKLHESDSSPSGDDDSETKAKKRKKASSAGSESAKSEAPVKDVKKELLETSKPLLQKLVGETTAPEKSKTESSKDPDVEAAKSEESAENSIAEPLDSLSESERHYVAVAYVSERRMEVETEQEGLEPGSVEASSTQAAEQYLAAVEQALEADKEADPGLLAEQVYQETIGVHGPETDDELDEPVDSSADALSESAVSDNLAQGNPTHSFEDVVPRLFETEQDDEPYSLAGSNSGGSSRGLFGYTGASFSGGNTPPVRLNSLNTAKSIESDNDSSDRQAMARGLLVGGVVGYLIGRRRGRIKTEKKLLPIQRKLENEVRTVQSRIAEKETRIRELVRTQMGVASREVIPRAYRETAQDNVPKKQPERLGLVTLKALEKPSAEQAKKQPASVEALSTEELMRTAEKISVGATTVRQVYETNLISERGLRHIVEEYRHGGDVQRTLTEELLIKELSYEQDPNVRDKPLKSASQAGTSDGAAAIGAVLAEARPVKLQSDPSIVSIPDDAPKPASSRMAQPALVVANLTALVVLAILVAVLIITHFR